MPVPTTIEVLRQRVPHLMEELQSVQGLCGHLRTAELNGIVLSETQKRMLDLLGAMSDEVVACLRKMGGTDAQEPATTSAAGAK